MSSTPLPRPPSLARTPTPPGGLRESKTPAPSFENGLLDITGLSTVRREANPSSGFLYKKRSKPLFPHMPNTLDVKQWGVGDCYLMAALISILNMAGGPQIILQMMRQDPESGDVFIRLHDLNTLQPRIIRFEKSIIVSWEHARDSMWVQFIEKAYAGFARGGYSKISGGHSHDCFKVLLGVASNHLVEGGVTATAQTDKLAGLFSNFLHGIYSEKRVKRSDVLQSIFHNDEAMMRQWEAWNTAPRKARWSSFLQKRIGASIKFVELDDFITFFEAECKADALDPAVKQTVLDWLRDQNPLSRKEYGTAQLDVYRRISAALRANKAVAAGTTKDLTGRSDGKGFSGGESKVAGMVATHAYAVLGVREDARHRLWILIRNPWGEGFFFGYGRAYDEVETKEGTVFRPKKTGSAESWLHLEDFCDTCKELYIADGEKTGMPTIANVASVDTGGGRSRSSAVTGPPPVPRPPGAPA